MNSSTETGKIHLLFLAALIFAANSLFAASDGRRQNFMGDGPESVGGALGGAMSAYGEDASSVFFNPAALQGQPSNVFLEHAKINDEASSSWFMGAVGEPHFKLGLGWKHDQLPLSSSKDGILLGFGFSQSLLPWVPSVPGLSLGATVGRVSKNLAGDSASSYLADMGAAWSRELGPWGARLGFVVHNVYFSGLQFGGGAPKERWPREMRTGLGISRWGTTVLAEAAVVDGRTTPAFGLEYGLGKILKLRAGYNDSFRLGLGMAFRDFGLAVGYRNADINNVPSAGLSYTWGRPVVVDYTNPISEFESRHKSLEAFLLTSLREKIQLMKVVDLRHVLKILAVAPRNPDAWNLLQSQTGDKLIKCDIPKSTRARRDYLTFAVAYANDEPTAMEYAQNYINRNRHAKIKKLVELIVKLDLGKPGDPKKNKKK